MPSAEPTEAMSKGEFGPEPLDPLPSTREKATDRPLSSGRGRLRRRCKELFFGLEVGLRLVTFFGKGRSTRVEAPTKEVFSEFFRRDALEVDFMAACGTPLLPRESTWLRRRYLAGR